MLDRAVVDNLELVLAVGGFVVGIAGLVYARTVQPRKSLAYKTSGIRLISDAGGALPKEVKVYYDDKPLENLTMSEILIWNNGNQTIKREDIVQLNPLRVEVTKGHAILKVQLEHPTRKEIAFKAQPHEEDQIQLLLTFDFLDQNDGVRFQILHTDQQKTPKIAGTITGIPSGLEDRGWLMGLRNYKTYVKLLRWTLLVLGSLVSFELFKPTLVGTFPVVLDFLVWMQRFKSPLGQTDYVLLSLFSVMLLVPLVLIWRHTSRYPVKIMETLFLNEETSPR